MDIADCYRLLQLTSRANIDDLKASYRRLARQWHPDINPGDELAHEKFIQVTEAYKTLQKVVPPASQHETVTATRTPRHTVKTRPSPQVKVSTRQPAKPAPSAQQQPRRQPPVHKSPASPATSTTQRRQPAPPPQRVNPPNPSTQTPPAQMPRARTTPLSPNEVKLKVDSYRQLQDLIQSQRFPRAVALIEALAQRLPEDAEVRQWQAIIYQSWGRQLIRERKLNQARAYLKKALNTDPHNKSLWAEIEQDFKKLEMVF
ncbi:DnaJ domain-containing protein [Acaryochloris sp. IP29b_bin.148]|uniref:DnaJ domain-containing protein n=1 Tax=Acaryochloris sp. IP29b_bin.148 TaxID=2969218 RepID=UPI00260F6BA8|nr:DnaJ domain-containing protein [Acaryochloris sp. IP29b_bin.148]